MDGGRGAWLDDSVGAWFVIRTRTRHEQILSRDLHARGVAHFLPLIKVARTYAGRHAVVEAPLFAGHLFVRGSAEQAKSAVGNRRIAKVVHVSDQNQLDGELRNLHLALNVDTPLHPLPFLSQGVRVEVRGGPLRGLQGVIESTDQRERIILQVQVLGQAVSVEVDPTLVEVLK